MEKMITIRVSEQEREQYHKIATESGFTSLSGLICFLLKSFSTGKIIITTEKENNRKTKKDVDSV